LALYIDIPLHHVISPGIGFLKRGQGRAWSHVRVGTRWTQGVDAKFYGHRTARGVVLVFWTLPRAPCCLTWPNGRINGALGRCPTTGATSPSPEVS
jgi:hypothetical protein